MSYLLTYLLSDVEKDGNLEEFKLKLRNFIKYLLRMFCVIEHHAMI